MKFFYLLLALCSVLLNGCVTQPTAQPTAQAQQVSKSTFFKQQDDISDILAFSHTFSNLDTESQKRTFDEINQQATKDRNNTSLQAKLAIMFALPSSYQQDPAKAASLIQTLLHNKTLSEPEVAYVEIIYVFTSDIIRQQLFIKDESKKNEATMQKYDVLQKKYNALEQKLTDLKNIEKKLSDRDIKTNDK
jgi:hypothetical protein